MASFELVDEHGLPHLRGRVDHHQTAWFGRVCIVTYITAEGGTKHYIGHPPDGVYPEPEYAAEWTARYGCRYYGMVDTSKDVR